MVERAYVDQRKRLLQCLGEKLVGTAGFGDTRRMIVREDHRRGVGRKCGLDDLAGIDAGSRQRAAKEFACTQ